MKKGEAELMISGPLQEDWDRFDHWSLLTEQHTLVVGRPHALSGRNRILLDDLKATRILLRPYCEQADRLSATFHRAGIDEGACHRVSSDADFLALAKAGAGVGFLPECFRLPEDVGRAHVADVVLARAVSLTAVAGRPRSPAATALITLLRAADWSRRAA